MSRSTRAAAAGAATLAAAALAVLGAVAAVTRAAAAVPATPPAAQPPRELRFPPFGQQTLANGLRVVTIERHTEPMVSLRLMVPAGKLYEPTAKAGLAGAAADLLSQGTAGRSAQQIAATIDGVGGDLSVGSGADFAYAATTVTADQLDLALDLLADVVLRPSYPAAELERWRRKSVSSLEVQRANAGYLADVAFQRLVFGTYPYAYPLRGTPESLRALTRDDVVAFHRAHYVPNGSILAVAGDFRPAPALAGIERAFGAWARGEPPRPAALALPSYERRRVLVIDKPDAVQTQVRVGQAAIAYTDPDYFTANVYSTVLGGTPFARLFREVREKRGLAYGAFCSLREQQVSGSFTASTSTKTASTVEALRVTLDEIAGMAKAPVPAAELDESKTYLNGSFPLQIEGMQEVATRVLTALAYGLGRDFLDTYRDRIAAVPPTEVQRFASSRLHPDRMVIVLVGNAAAFGADLAKAFGPFETIPARDLDPLAPDLRRAAAAKPGG